jgi:hypothetical protein
MNDSGLTEGEDAPDIIANTFLSEVTNDQLERIGNGFLSHPHCKHRSFTYFLP